MFSNVFKYNLRMMLRQKIVLFWSLAFPLIMSILFTLAFANLYSGDVIKEEIKLAYVEAGDRNPLYDLKQILSSMNRGKGDAKLFSLTAVDEATARQMVLEKKVAAAVVDGTEPSILALRMDLQQSILKQVLDQVSATRNTVTNIIKAKPLAAMSGLPEQLNQGSFVKQQPLGQDRMNPGIVHFFALIAMASLSAVTAGAAILISQQANKSVEGARLSVAPANKWLRLSASGLAGYLVQLSMTVIVFLFMHFVLGQNFGDQIPFILLVIALGTLAGYLMGMAIACTVRGSDNAIIGMTVGAYLFSSFLSGLMGSQIKRLVDTSLPWIGAVNPGSMIVNALYSLYYYQSPDYRYVWQLAIVCLLFAGVSALTLRRRYHDSI